MAVKRTRLKKNGKEVMGGTAPTRTPFCYVTKAGKVVSSRALDSYVLKDQEEQSQQLKADRFANKYGDLGLIQPLYNPERLAYAPEVNTYHARACQVKARDTAGLGWDLISQVEEPNETIKEEIREFLEGQKTPLVTIFYRHQYDLEVIGHGGLEIVRAGYQPTGRPAVLAHIPGHTLRIHESDNKFAQKRGLKTRWFKRIGYPKDIDKETGYEYELGKLSPEKRASEILWNALYSQRSDYYGVPDVIPALGAIHGDVARRDYNIAFFDNFGVPAYAVFITGDFDPGEPDPDTGMTELEESIEKHFKNLSESPHSTLIMTVPSRENSTGDVKIDFQPLATDVKDASFRLYRKDNRDEIISAHGVPPYRLGITETGSLGGSTAAESTEIYKNSVINPRQELLESLINQYIIQDENGFATKDWAFKFRGIDTKDEAHDIEIAGSLFGMGAFRIRDVIQAFGQRFGIEDDPEDERLDMRFVQGQPLEIFVQQIKHMEEGGPPPEAPGGGAGGEAEKVMKSLQEKLLKVAMKYGRDGDAAGNGRRDRTIPAVVDVAKELGRLDKES